MQIIKTYLVFVFLLQINNITAQSTYLGNANNEYQLLDRLDIKNMDSGRLTLFSTKPYLRKTMVKYVEFLDSALRTKYSENKYDISSVDRYNMEKLLKNNPEWLQTTPTSYNSKKTFLNRFFVTKNNFYEVNQKDIKIVLNPMIQQTQGIEANNKKRIFLNSKGLEVRGLIGKKIGFYAMLTDNQENGPTFYRSRVDSLQAVPGNAYYKRFKPVGVNDRGQDYFDYRGYITFKAGKLVDVQYGFDKNFIGNGQRSLFLSDISAPMLFLKLNTNVWKLNYQNLFMELTPTFTGLTGGSLNGKKYAAMHHLGIEVGNNASIGLFESIIFQRKNNFELSYLVPVIFYRAVESGLGSADNAIIGADFKVNFAQSFQFYGQVLVDEFKLSYFKEKNWGEKIGGQAGLKYIDVAGIKNLDFQFEWNIVRPYTYSHYDSTTTYTHYNQPLAHPLGANFNDLLVILKYQPSNKLNFIFKAFAMGQGLDSTKKQTRTFGGNIFRTYNVRVGDKNQLLLQGVRGKTVNASLAASYELLPNLYADASLYYRSFNTSILPKRQTTTMLNIGLRWNMVRRELDY